MKYIILMKIMDVILSASLAKALLAIILAATGLILVITLIKYVTKHNKQEKRPARPKDIVACSALYSFSKAEIEKAITYGNEKKCLGRGSAGMVYKGILPSGQFVAIKQIYKSNTADSFTREMEGLSRVRHPNLVCLFGCCVEDGEQYLVYEYCSAGNLAQHLLSTSLPLFLLKLFHSIRKMNVFYKAKVDTTFDFQRQKSISKVLFL